MTIKGLYQINPLRFFLALFSYVLIPFSAIGQSYLLMYQITALADRKLKLWLWLTLAEFIVLLISTASQSLGLYLSNKQIQEYNHQIRANTLRHYYYDGQDHQVSTIQNRFTTDLKNVDSNYLQRILNIAQMIGYIAFSIIVLLLIHWSLLLVTLILVGISFYLPKVLERPMQAAFSNISDSSRKYLDTAAKWLIGINVLQRYMAGGKLFKTMNEAAKEVEAAKVKQTKIGQELAVMNGLVSNLLMLALFVFTSLLIANKLVIFGTITTVGNLQYYISMGLQYLSNYRGQIKSTKPLNKRIAQDSTFVKSDHDGNLQLASAFAGKNLSVSFPHGETLSFPDFEVNAGEKVLLTGDSGAGKSTLFKLILGELKPTTGEITYFDKDMNIIKPDLSKLGYIAQTPRLFPATIAENITMFDKNLNSKLPQTINEVGLQNDIKKFDQGIKEQINLDKLNISGGQRQKIVLARAKIHNSNIILIDEGTSAIDQNATLNILKDLANSNATIFFIAHNFNDEMRKIFDREIHIQKTK